MLGYLQVTRLLVDAVTISTANSEREHCFLPSHKGSPYHVHKLAERVLPAELLQVFHYLHNLCMLFTLFTTSARHLHCPSVLLKCLTKQPTRQDTLLCNIYVIPADTLLCLCRVQNPTMMLWRRGLNVRRVTWARLALVSRIGVYLYLRISEILGQNRSYRCRDAPSSICFGLCPCTLFPHLSVVGSTSQSPNQLQGCCLPAWC